MSGNLREIAQVIRALPRRDVEELREWIEVYLEGQIEVTEQFAVSIDRGKKDIAEGNVRVQKPDQV